MADKIGEGFVEIKLRVNKLEAALKKAQKDTESSSKKMVSSFKKVAGAIGAALIIREIKQFTQTAVREFADFSSGIAEVGTLSKEVRDDLKGFGDQLLKVAVETAQPLDRLQKAMFDAVSAGIPAGESIEFLGTAGKLAVAGVTDISTATDGLTSIINAYKLEASEAERVADALFMAQKGGKTTVAELSAAIGRLAPVTAAANISMEEMLASLSTATLAGISTNESVTGLRAAVLSIVAPIESAQKVAEEWKIELGESALASKGFTGVLKDMIKKTGGSIEKLKLLGITQESLAVVSTLLKDDASELTRQLKAQGDAAGATEAAFGDMSKELLFQLDQLSVMFKKMFVEIGEKLAPEMENLIVILKDSLPAMQELATLIATVMVKALGLMADTIKEINHSLEFFFGAKRKNTLKEQLADVTAQIKILEETDGDMFDGVKGTSDEWQKELDKLIAKQAELTKAIEDEQKERIKVKKKGAEKDKEIEDKKGDGFKSGIDKKKKEFDKFIEKITFDLADETDKAIIEYERDMEKFKESQEAKELIYKRYIKALIDLEDDKTEKIKEAVDLQKVMAQDITDNIKMLWEGTGKSFEDIWNAALLTFIANMATIVLTAKATEVAVQASNAAMTAGISLVIGGMATIIGGMFGGQGPSGPSFAKRLDGVFSDFLSDFGNKIDEFTFEIASLADKFDILSSNITMSSNVLTSSINEIADLSSDLTRLQTEMAQISTGTQAETPEEEAAEQRLNDLLNEYRVAEDRIVELTGTIVENADAMIESVEERYRLERREIERIGEEIERLYGRQADWVSSINQDILDVSRMAFTPEQMREAVTGDIAALERALTGATGEGRIDILEDLRRANLDYLNLTRDIFGMESAEFAMAQAETIAALQDIRDEGISEFDQMIRVQRDQLEELTGVRDASQAIQNLNERQTEILETLRAIGSGDTSDSVISRLLDYVRWTAEHTVPNTPSFQMGGVVDKPTLANIGEGGQSEAIVPLPDNRSIPVKFEGGGMGGPIQVNVILDSKILGRALFDLSQRRSLQFDPGAILERGEI